MSSILRSGDSTPRQLDRKAEPDEQVTEDDAKDAPRVARLLYRLLRDVAELKRRWAPRRIDFEDYTVTAGTSYRFVHGFSGRVRWWVVDWQDNSGSGSGAWFYKEVASTDDSTLVLTSVIDGIATIRVEEVG